MDRCHRDTNEVRVLGAGCHHWVTRLREGNEHGADFDQASHCPLSGQQVTKILGELLVDRDYSQRFWLGLSLSFRVRVVKRQTRKYGKIWYLRSASHQYFIEVMKKDNVCPFTCNPTLYPSGTCFMLHVSCCIFPLPPVTHQLAIIYTPWVRVFRAVTRVFHAVTRVFMCCRAGVHVLPCG